jgi:hypothetical protein
LFPGSYPRLGGAGGTILVIRCVNGIELGGLSYFPDETEIVICPGLQFTVVQAIRNRWGVWGSMGFDYVKTDAWLNIESELRMWSGATHDGTDRMCRHHQS